MGVNTNIYFMYGWELEITQEFSDYADEVDYQYPKGVIATDMDSTKVYVGVILDQSGDLRWDMPNFGNVFYSEEKALQKLADLEGSLGKLVG